MTIQAYVESIACHAHDLFEDVYFTPVCICCLCCHVVRMCGKDMCWWYSGKQSHESIKNADTQQGCLVQFRELKVSIAIVSSDVESSHVVAFHRFRALWAWQRLGYCERLARIRICGHFE